MHHADFASTLLREIDEKIKTTEAAILSGAVGDWVGYHKAVARRTALREFRELIVHGLGRDEARPPLPR